MIEYTDEIVLKMFKRYEMLANSIALINDDEQKNNIYFELGKILNKIIESTNIIYENKFHEIENKEVVGFDEQKTKLTLLIELIKEREIYLNSLISKHYIFTSKKIEEPSFLGKLDIDGYINKIEDINNYLDNLKLINKYNEEIEKLNYSIELAKEKIEISNTLNNELEVKLKELMDDIFRKNNYLILKDEKEEIEKIYKELDFILGVSEENVKINNSLSYNEDYEDERQYEELEELYLKYNEKMVILELMDIYDKKTKNYEELIEKRNHINDIINKIPTSNLYYELNDFLKEQYSNLLKQKEDIITLKSLEDEKKYKLSLIEDKKQENNSDIYKDIIKELNDQEERIREQKLLEIKKEEELNRQKLIEEQKERQEEIKKRQKLIEEQRKKEMEERAKKILQEQNKYQKKNLDEEKEDEHEEDKMIDNPIFKEIKNEIESDDLDDEKQDLGLNSFNNISNVLPNDLDDYMKSFNNDDKEVFDKDKIFVDF